MNLVNHVHFVYCIVRVNVIVSIIFINFLNSVEPVDLVDSFALTLPSDFTPTVGLGCRSGGYIIFFVVALTNFTIELLLWPCNNRSHCDRAENVGYAGTSQSDTTKTITERISKQLHEPHLWLRRCRWAHKYLEQWDRSNMRQRIGAVILTPMDVINTAWLTYIVLAQTFGAYRSCRCMSSNWGTGKGYVDFSR